MSQQLSAVQYMKLMLRLLL